MSNRQTIVATLKKLVVATIEDLAGETGWPERKVRDTIGDMKTSGMIKSERDEVTGKAAYRLTTEAQQKQAADAVAASKLTAPVVSDVATSSAKENSQIETLRAQLKNAEQMRDEHFASLEGLQDDMRRQVQRAVAAEQNRDDLKKQVDDLFLQLNQAQETIHSMELEAAQAKDVKDAAIGYIVRVAGKKPRICMKPESARNAALASARAHGRADVLAMVPVGSAKRDAVFKEAA